MKSKGLYILMFLLVIGLAGCGLFRKKNRCHTCPSWGNNVETISTFQEEKA